MNKDIDVLGKAKTSLVDVDLNDLCVFGEVIEVVLGEGTENGESRA